MFQGQHLKSTYTNVAALLGISCEQCAATAQPPSLVVLGPSFGGPIPGCWDAAACLPEALNSTASISAAAAVRCTLLIQHRGQHAAQCLYRQHWLLLWLQLPSMLLQVVCPAGVGQPVGGLLAVGQHSAAGH